MVNLFIFNNLDKIIYVVNLFIFNNLDEIIYDQVQMGDHLLSCLDMGQTHPFTKFRAYNSPVAYLKRTKYTSVLSILCVQSPAQSLAHKPLV